MEHQNNYLEGIDLVSFDVWLTLIRSHPDYKLNRAKVLRFYLGAESVDLESFLAITRSVDKESDAESDKTGRQLGLPERVRAVYEALSPDQRVAELTDEIIEAFDDASMKLIVNYLPGLIEEDLLATLSEIERRGIKMAIVSNTGFIDGRHMRIVLERLGISQFINVLIFSNEVGVAKPSKLVFQALVEKSGVDGRRILHIGDNLKADYEGATSCGIRALHLSAEQKEEFQIPTLASLVK